MLSPPLFFLCILVLLTRYCVFILCVALLYTHCYILLFALYAFYLRTPTKHSTNVETAASVVPVPTVVNRPLTSTSSEAMLSTTIRSSPVRLLLNSTATIPDTLISVQPQFAIFPSVKLTSTEQVSERPIVINSSGFFTNLLNALAPQIFD